jgi:hypothetical protein
MNNHRNVFIRLILLGLPLIVVVNLKGQTTPLKYLQKSPNTPFVTISQASSKQNAETQFELQYKSSGNTTERISFPKEEHYIADAQEILFTGTIKLNAAGNEDKYLKSYDWTDNKLRLIGTLKLPAFDYLFYPIKDHKNILMSDEWEGLGHEVALYNSTLNKISTYRPFGERGFKQSLSHFKGDKAAFIFYPVEAQSTSKLVLLNTDSGKIEFEKDIYSNDTKITSITLISNFIFLTQHIKPAEQELLCFNSAGTLLWKKMEYVYALEAFKENNESLAFAMDKENYWFINPETGMNSQKQPLKEMIPIQKWGDQVWVDVTSNYKSTAVTLLVSKKGENKASDYTHEVYIINSTQSKPISQQTIQSSSEVLSFTKLFSTILINDSNNQILYQYEN